MPRPLLSAIFLSLVLVIIVSFHVSPSTNFKNDLAAAGRDTRSPSVSITSPRKSSTVSGTINVTADAHDNVAVAGVQFKLDGVNLGAEDTVPAYGVAWDTKSYSNGQHSLSAIARDTSGNVSTARITVYISNPVGDTTPPSVSVTSPASGSTISNTVNVTASASDNTAVAGVQFKLDGANLGSEDTVSAYGVSWNTTGATNGTHVLTATARDTSGNTTTSGGVTVTVSNTVQDTTPPSVTVTAPADGADVTGTINITASASDNVGVMGVQFRLDGANFGVEDQTPAYGVSWDTTSATSGTHVITAIARDSAGNTTTATNVTVNVSNAQADTQAPTVSMTAPANGGTVSGPVNVTANAADNVGVVGVQFLLDGSNLGNEDVNPAYGVSWDTTGATSGTHTLSARARDAAGNVTTSSSISVTVDNAPSGGGGTGGSSPVASYNFDDGSTVILLDRSGNGNNGTLTNGPQWTNTGIHGGALAFNGSGAYVNIPSSASLNITNTITLEAWVNTSGGAGYQNIITKDGLTSGYGLFLDTLNLEYFIGAWSGTSAQNVTINTWTHVALTYDGTTVRVYRNGTEVITNPHTGPISTNGTALLLGSTNGSGFLSGQLDDVRVYNRALSSSEIASDMNTPVGGAPNPDDTQAPSTPTNLSASAVSSSQINLSWTASIDNVVVSVYRVYRNGVQVGTSSTGSYSDTGLTPSTQYTYTVAAVDSAGNVSPQSSPASATTLASTPPPSGGPVTLLFSSDWSTGTGSSDAVVRDTSKARPWTETGGGAGQLSVISSSGLGFPTTNVLRVQYSGETSAETRVDATADSNQNWPLVATGESLVYRLYYNVSLADGMNWTMPAASHHPIEPHFGQCPFDWEFKVGVGNSGTWTLEFHTNTTFWVAPTLTKFQTYRLEWRLTRIGSNVYTPEIRVYNSSGTIVADRSNFVNPNTGRTMAQDIASNSANITMDLDQCVRSMTVGENGASTWTPSGPTAVVYYGGVAIGRTTDSTAWIGPYVAGEHP